jgi:uncharacterized RDD family membrane protein YckC
METVRWGGLFRRCCALSIDIAVLSLFSLLLYRLISVAYRVGLAAYQHSLSWGALPGLFRVFLVAWLFFVSAYFVVLHGAAGKTVGQWFFGLRVVGARQEPITYGRALVRWIAALATAPLLLGFIRILWNREKRGWHDALAGTWVVRE